MKSIVCISDTHGKHHELTDVPNGDIIIHSGDISSLGRVSEVIRFLDWFGKLPHQYKIFCAGNHDFLFQNQPMYANALVKEYGNIIYLENSSVTIDNIKIYGSPITPTFYSWAFMSDRGKDIKKYWDAIPDDTDILITHGPPYGILDKTKMTEDHVGCEELLKKVEEVKPLIHVFGHIHSASGIHKTEHTTFINASVLNDQYHIKYQPTIITI